MEKEVKKINLTRLLSEIKLIDSKIDSKSDRLVPVAFKVNNKIEARTPVSDKDYKEKVQSESDTIEHLFELKTRLKSLLIATNNSTKVNFQGKSWSISDLIVKKDYIISEKQYYTTILNRIIRAETDMDNFNKRVHQESLNIIKPDTPAEIAAKLSKSYEDVNKRTLYDPLHLKEKCIAKLEEIEEFQSNVDDELSVVNAMTTVEVPV